MVNDMAVVELWSISPNTGTIGEIGDLSIPDEQLEDNEYNVLYYVAGYIVQISIPVQQL